MCSLLIFSIKIGKHLWLMKEIHCSNWNVRQTDVSIHFWRHSIVEIEDCYYCFCSSNRLRNSTHRSFHSCLFDHEQSRGYYKHSTIIYRRQRQITNRRRQNNLVFNITQNDIQDFPQSCLIQLWSSHSICTLKTFSKEKRIPCHIRGKKDKITRRSRECNIIDCLSFFSLSRAREKRIIDEYALRSSFTEVESERMELLYISCFSYPSIINMQSIRTDIWRAWGKMTRMPTLFSFELLYTDEFAYSSTRVYWIITTTTSVRLSTMKSTNFWWDTFRSLSLLYVW